MELLTWMPPTGRLQGGTTLRTENRDPRKTAPLRFYERRNKGGWRDEGDSRQGTLGDGDVERIDRDGQPRAAVKNLEQQRESHDEFEEWENNDDSRNERGYVNFDQVLDFDPQLKFDQRGNFD
ncbi:Hypothetical predicted protein [Olea europaea subsp. europaea]|uniref:Uncharacterized protein n=1 Tax=Olea europaea subsp. europaea TaxID=158383 RepID=A0A8S0REX4_OLEEU|nr:Hypothetical predicted protein [Olea europaea subsp. europaea]